MVSSRARVARSHEARVASYSTVSTALALLSDRQLRGFVDDAPVLGTGIGGQSKLVDVGGTDVGKTPVFVKQVPLTDRERHPDNVMSTANVFGLPTFYQYGVGSAGFGAWRELAAHVMTTNWVLAQQCESFPLLYHWRVLPGLSSASADSMGLSRRVEYWDGSPAVRERLEALAGATATVLLFLEYIPQNLHEWFPAQLEAGDDAADAACAMVERSLRVDVPFMNANGLWHFDAHSRNVLTDGQRCYYTDFGLATSPRFTLSPAERDFLDAHQSYDECYTVTLLVRLVATVAGVVDRDELIRHVAAGGEPGTMPERAAAIIKRYAPVAVVMNQFFDRLFHESRNITYPKADLDQARAVSGLGPSRTVA